MDASPPRPGKIAPAVFDEVIRPRLGAARADVRVGPRAGVDAGVVDLGSGRVLAVTTDPLYAVPAFGWERAAWFALHIVASDLATTGLAPAHACVDLNLPLDFDDAALAAFWEAFDRACRELDVAVVTGHTGRYAGCSLPILGGLTLSGIGNAAQLVTPSQAHAGDRVIVTKGPALETAAHLGLLAPARVQACCGKAVVQEAAALFDSLSIVPDARAAVAAGVGDRGVTMLHDATEFGLWGALVEVAGAAGTGIRVDRTRIPMPAAVRAVAAAFGFDPYTASSAGTLVATVRAHAAGDVVRRLADAGIAAAEVGELVPESDGRRVWDGKQLRPLAYPDHDPFWPILQRELAAEGTRIDRLF